MRVEQLIEKAKTEFTHLTNATINAVTGFSRVDGGGMVSLEVLEKRSIPDSMDVLGIYEVFIDNEGNFLGFERKRLRRRCDTSLE